MNPSVQQKSSSAVSSIGNTLSITSILRGNTSTRTSSPLVHRGNTRETAHKAGPSASLGDTGRFHPPGCVAQERIYKSPLSSLSLGLIFRQLSLSSSIYQALIINQPFEVSKTTFSNSAKMQFSATTLVFFVNLALSAAVPEAAPVGMVQKLDARDVSENLIFGRSFPCASNDPTTCCAVSDLCALTSHHQPHS